MSDTAYVAELPPCDICKQDQKTVPAYCDGKTKAGPWAYMCRPHWDRFGVGRLGTGYGQRLVVGERPVRSERTIRDEVRRAVEANDWDAVEDAVGDGDPAAYLDF